MVPRPNCTTTSRASCGTPPPHAMDGVKTTTAFTDEEVEALLPSSDGLARFQAPPFSEQAARFFSAAKFSVDAPLSDNDAQMLSEDQFTDEEVAATLAGMQHAAPRPGNGHRQAAAAKKRKRTPASRCPSSFNHRAAAAAAAAGSPLAQAPHRAAAAKKRKKMARLVRDYHRKIAARILAHRFRAPEPSRGRTSLRCQCAELAAAGGDGCCALHQDAGDGGEEWAREVRRCVPMAAGPGEVRVPRLAKKGSVAEVVRYMRWRRAVWMPTRFYLAGAAERGVDRWMSNYETAAG